MSAEHEHETKHPAEKAPVESGKVPAWFKERFPRGHADDGESFDASDKKRKGKTRG